MYIPSSFHILPLQPLRAQRLAQPTANPTSGRRSRIAKPDHTNSRHRGSDLARPLKITVPDCSFDDAGILWSKVRGHDATVSGSDYEIATSGDFANDLCIFVS